jgi:hypothetical protein
MYATGDVAIATSARVYRPASYSDLDFHLESGTHAGANAARTNFGRDLHDGVPLVLK